MAEGPFKDHNDVRLMLLYSETLAHLIYAAADIVLVCIPADVMCCAKGEYSMSCLDL